MKKTTQKKLKIILFSVLISVCAVIFGACSDTDIIAKMKEEGRCQIHLDYMGGKVSDFYLSKDYMADPGSKLWEPGKKLQGVTPAEAPKLLGYEIEGWYTAYKVESDGDVLVFDEADKWDFDKDTVSKDMTLYVKWRRQFSVVIHFDRDENGEYMRSKEFFAGGEYLFYQDGKLMLRDPTTDMYWSGHTLLGYYYDEDLSKGQEVSFPITHPEVRGEEAINIYSDWIIGNYTLVYTAYDLRRISPRINYMLMQDIEFDEADPWAVSDSYEGIFDGNGYKISGVRYSVDNEIIGAAITEFGLFKALNGATVRNVTFEDCSVTVTARPNFSKLIQIGFLAATATNATLDSITLVDCSLTVTNASSITNIRIRPVIATSSGSTETNCDFDDVTVNQ